MRTLRTAWQYYKSLRAEEKQRKKLLSQDMNYNFLEELIKKCNSNPNLKIEIFLKDQTRILMRTYEEKKTASSRINDVDYEAIR